MSLRSIWRALRKPGLTQAEQLAMIREAAEHAAALMAGVDGSAGPIEPPAEEEPDPEMAPAPFEEKCQSLRGGMICRAWADSFCTRCTIQVCLPCRPKHQVLYARHGSLHILQCDGMNVGMPDTNVLTDRDVWA